MTNNQHGQVPEALIDLIDAYAETRHRCGGVYNAKTEAARKAVIEALSGVQALSAAPAAKKSALRTYPNPIVPLIKPVSEQEKMRALYLASSNLMAYLGRNGAIHPDGHAADVLMNCLNDLDGGEFDETLFAASPTPPAEQQDAPKAAPVEPDPADIIAGALQISRGHATEMMREALEAAPQQEAQEPCGWPADRVRIEKTEKNGWCAYLDIQDEDGNRTGTINLCRGIDTENTARALVQNWMREFVPNPKQLAAPQQEAQEPVMVYRGRCTIDCGEHGHHDMEMLRMIPSGSKLYTAPQPAPAPLSERDAFERDWEKRHAPVPINIRTHDDGRYGDSSIQDAWESWQARAALAAQWGKDA